MAALFESCGQIWDNRELLTPSLAAGKASQEPSIYMLYD